MERKGAGAGWWISLLIVVSLTACTGGKEGTAAEEKAPEKNGVAAVDPQPTMNAREALGSINRSIPVYAGARYRDDLTRRDSVMIRNQYGPNAEVYTLASDDSFPQVYHYYITYLAQFRAFPATNPYPPEQKDWRTLEVSLNEAMQDPFIPGEALDPNGKRVILQVAETEAEPKTVIRYIVAPPSAVTSTASAAPIETSR